MQSNPKNQLRRSNNYRYTESAAGIIPGKNESAEMQKKLSERSSSYDEKYSNQPILSMLYWYEQLSRLGEARGIT